VSALARAPVADALAGASEALAAAGVETARLDAEVLLAAATGWDRARIASAPEEPLPPGASRAMAEMVRRRLRREPVAYILGRKGFRRIELAVDPRVLIPRPETELLIEVAVELAPATVLDVGTGSGAVALAIADETDARVTATDTSAGALELARENAERLGLGGRVEFAAGTLPGAESGGAAYDLIVANLPYVSEREMPQLAPEIREFEPRGALVAGETGLEAIEELLAALAPAGVEAGAVALEVGAGQAGRVGELVEAAGFGRVERRRDLAGIERVVVGRR
jgi:release factor glutamine methyltransferase